MSNTAAIILFVSLFTIGAAFLLWLASRASKRSQALAAARAQEFERRQSQPDFAGLERLYGHSLPAAFHAMHSDLQLISSENLLIALPNCVEDSTECYVCWFEPADLESAYSPWPGCENLFPIANNGAGDEFLVDLKESDPEVFYHLHETGEKKGLGFKLSEFITASRRPVPDE